MTLTPQQLDSFRSIIGSAQRIVLTTHINPDGDGLGSEVALALSLSELGKDAVILNHSATPDFFRFLDEANLIEQFDAQRHARVIKEADVVMIVDTNHPDRIASLKDDVVASRSKKIIIDHHLDPDPFGDLFLIDDSAAATGEIVFGLLHLLGIKQFSPAVATALYAAIMTDTGSFRYPKTDAGLHRLVAELLDFGADPVMTYERIYDQSPVNRMLLLAGALSSIETFYEGRVATMTITQDHFRRTGTAEPDVDRFAPYPMGIKGVYIGLMFTELEDHIKISFRSRGDIWINKLAQEFGGNGHKNAAGARVNNKTLKELKKSVIDRSHYYLP